MNTPNPERAVGPVMTALDGYRQRVHAIVDYMIAKTLHPRAALESQRLRRKEMKDSTLGVA